MRHVCVSSPYFRGLDERHPPHWYLSPASERTDSADLQRIQYAQNSSFIWLHRGEMKDSAAAPGRDALLGAEFISCIFLFTFYTFCASRKKLEYPLVRSSSALTFCPIQHKYQTARGLLLHCVGKGEESSEMNPED